MGIRIYMYNTQFLSFIADTTKTIQFYSVCHRWVICVIFPVEGRIIWHVTCDPEKISMKIINYFNLQNIAY